MPTLHSLLLYKHNHGACEVKEYRSAQTSIFKAIHRTQQHLQQDQSISAYCPTVLICCCSDEVYANSIFKPCDFISMIRLAAAADQHGLDPEEVNSYVHIVFGLSKDWCASGLRVGCLYTRNQEVLKAMQNLSYFGCVSGLAQYLIAEMLEDTSFVDSYLKENARRLGESYDTLAGERFVAFSRASVCMGPLVCKDVHLQVAGAGPRSF